MKSKQSFFGKESVFRCQSSGQGGFGVLATAGPTRQTEKIRSKGRVSNKIPPKAVNLETP